MERINEDALMPLYTAIGFIVVNWGLIESPSAMLTNLLYCGPRTSKKPGHMPKFLGDQFRFQRHCLYSMPELNPIKDDWLRIIEATEEEKDSRELFVHSALNGHRQEDNIYMFTNLEAKTDFHQATEWEFQGGTFPATQAKLLHLVSAWNQLARNVIPLLEGLE